MTSSSPAGGSGPGTARLRRLSPGVTAFVLGAAVGVALLAVFLSLGYRNAERQAEVDTLADATLNATRLEGTLNRVSATIGLTELWLAEREWPATRIVDGTVQPTAEWAMLARDFPEVSGILVWDARGDLRYVSRPLPASLTEPDPERIREVSAAPSGKVLFSSSLKSRVTGKPILVAYGPIKAGDGTFRGATAVAISLDNIEASFASAGVGEQGVVSLRRSDDGRLVARYPDAAGEANTPPSNLRLLEMVRTQAPNGVARFTSRIDGVERIQAYVKVGAYPFYVSVGNPTERIFGPWRRLAFGTSAALAVALAIIALLLRRAQAQAQARRHIDSRYRVMVEAQDDAVCRARPDGTLVFVNSAYRRFFEPPGTDIVGSNWLMRKPAAEREAIRETIARQCASGGQALREDWEVCQDGELRCFQWITSALRDERGTVVETQGVGRDVTALKRATELVLFDEGRLNLAMSVAGMGWSDIDPIAGNSMHSAQTATMLGREAREQPITVEEWQQSVHPDDLPAVVASWAKVTASDDVTTVEYRRGSGEATRWYLTAGRTVARTPDGAASRVVAVHMDITSRKRLELQLREDEMRVKLAMEIGRQGWFEIDVAADTIVESPSWRRSLGFPPQRAPVAYRDWLEQVHPDDVAVILERRAGLATSDAVLSLDYRRRVADGRWRWMKAIGQVTARDVGGRPLRIIGVVTDTTEQREQKQALLESEHQYRALADGGAALIWAADPQGDVVYVNNRVREFIGANEGRVQRSDGFGFIHEDDRARCERAFAAAMAARVPFSLECRARNGKGEYRHLRIDGQPRLDVGGRFIGYIGYGIDITEAREAALELARHREQLQSLVEERTRELSVAKQRAEAANVAKSAFLANMSHELRTPLNAIAGMAYLLRKGGLDAGQQERLDAIDVAGRHLLEIINAVLELSRIEAGKFELQDRDLDVAEVVRTAVAMVQDRADAKGLALVVEPSAATGVLRGDATRLYEALQNYLNNAIKFTERGTVTVRVRVADRTEDDVTVRFEVEDTGIGIAATDLPRLFTAFEQADGSNTRKYGGTGLGLAVTLRLAQLMGGDAGAQSEPGVGSTFWFTARLAKVAHAALADVDGPVAEAALRERHAGKRVLVVEDEPVNLEVVQSLLGDAMLAVDAARDGAQAVERATREPYDLILMDVRMPVMNGLDATRLIRRTAANGATPVVALTANAFTEDAQDCRDAGMDEFVAKPVEPARLFHTVLHWLDAGKR